MPHVYTVRITKFMNDLAHIDRRKATIYEGWVSEDLKKSGRKTVAVDIFYAHMPDVFYNWYKPERERLTKTEQFELGKELDRQGL